LLLLQPICAILDDICASAHATTVGDNFLYHTWYLITTYFSPMIKGTITKKDFFEVGFFGLNLAAPTGLRLAERNK